MAVVRNLYRNTGAQTRADSTRWRTVTEQASKKRARVMAMLTLSSLVLVTGCHRAFYREEADCQAYALVNQKASAPDWPLEGYTIDVDPMSRMFDPFDPDYPPMPSDDPTSHELMHCVYCMKGYPCWHANGETSQRENPNWLNSLPIDERGRVTLDVPTSLHIARLHSTDYQSQLEELYLSALDVSFERFRFDTQFSAGTGILGSILGKETGNRNAATTPSDTGSATQLDIANSAGATKLFASGGQLVVGLANSLIWQFAGPSTDSYSSLIDFSLVQPLLRTGGRDVVMERLTLSERTLLANVRQMERWRRGFYLEVITGRDAGTGPSRRGGVFGGTGFDGFAGTGGGGFGNFGTTGTGGTGIGVTGGAGAAQAGGFLGLLQDQQDLVNQRGNIAALQSSVVQLEEYFLAGRIDYFQVELARQALYNAQSRLLNAEAAYQSSLDSFKRTLGISQNIELEVRDDLIAPFQLVDTVILPTQNRLTALQQSIGRNIIAILGEPEDAVSVQANGAVFAKADGQSNGDQESLDTDGGLLGRLPRPDGERNVDRESTEDGDDLPISLTWDDAIATNLQTIRSKLEQARDICDGVLETNFPRAMEDLAKLNQAVPQRRRDMAMLKKRFEARLDVTNSTSTIVMDGDGQQHDNPLPIEPERLSKLPTQLGANLAELKDRFQQMSADLDLLDAAIAKLIVDGPQLSEEALVERVIDHVVEEVPSRLSALAADVLSLTLIQARARTESVALTPIEIDWQNAVEIARSRRRDWMNSRASLVDSWRLIQFNADALESDLDIVLSGDMGTIGDNAIDFRQSTGTIQAGIEFDAPLARLGERNSYRQSLIEYQQARRSYYRYVDAVAQSLRSTIRSLEVNQLNFELRRAAVEVAIAQVELARLRLQEPPKPDEDATLGATTARDLVSALTDLLTVQNDFLSVWINQEALRRSLDFDMGTMNLAPDGDWIDPGPLVANSPMETIEAIEAGEESVVGGIDKSDETESGESERGDNIDIPDDLMPIDEPEIESAIDGEFLDSSFPAGVGRIQRTSYVGVVDQPRRHSYPKRSTPTPVDPPRRLPAVLPARPLPR